MSLTGNKALVRSLIDEVWNRHQPEALGRFAGAEVLPEFQEHTRQFLAAFPDVQVTIEDLIAEGDKVVARLLVRGTNTGPFAGRPATDRPVEFRSCRIYQLAGGKVIQTWAMQDRMGLMEQLGWAQTPGGVNWAAAADDPSEPPGTGA